MGIVGALVAGIANTCWCVPKCVQVVGGWWRLVGVVVNPL